VKAPYVDLNLPLCITTLETLSITWDPRRKKRHSSSTTFFY